jgi:hypothetical protein
VEVAVSLMVVNIVTLLNTGKVVVLVTVTVDSTHLTQTVLTKALACFTKLLSAAFLASVVVAAGAFVVVEVAFTTRLAFALAVTVMVTVGAVSLAHHYQ